MFHGAILSPLEASMTGSFMVYMYRVELSKGYYLSMLILLFEVSASKLLASNIDCAVFTVSDKDRSF